MARIPWYINSRPYSFEGGGDIIYKSGRKNDNPLPEGEEVTVVAQAPSYFKKKNGELLSDKERAFVNDVRLRSDYGGLSKFMLGAALAPAAIYGGTAALRGLKAGQDAYRSFLLSHPTVSTGINVAANTGNAYSLASDNGLKKTYGLFKDGNYKDAALSLAGDALDAYGFSRLSQLPYRIYASGLSSGLRGTGRLFAQNVSNTSNAIKNFNPFLRSYLQTTPDLGERLRAIRNGYSNIFHSKFNFLSDMRKFNPLQNISLSFGAYNPITPSVREYQYLLDTANQANDIQNVVSLVNDD